VSKKTTWQEFPEALCDKKGGMGGTSSPRINHSPSKKRGSLILSKLGLADARHRKRKERQGGGDGTTER